MKKNITVEQFKELKDSEQYFMQVKLIGTLVSFRNQENYEKGNC